jgi:uncharacterized protein YraI
MTPMKVLLVATAIAAVPVAAHAATSATAVADLNIRSGPGPQYPVVGLIGQNDSALINGCLEGSKWCVVEYNGAQGWAYSDYLVADLSGSPVVLTDGYSQVGVPVTTFEPSEGAEAGGAAGATTGIVGGAIAGALIAGPVGAVGGAVIGGAAGGVTGSAAGAAIDPPQEVRTYVTANPPQPVYLEGEVVVGAGVPESVELMPVPDYGYKYVYVNGQPVLVDPESRRIVYVVRQ